MKCWPDMFNFVNLNYERHMYNRRRVRMRARILQLQPLLYVVRAAPAPAKLAKLRGRRCCCSRRRRRRCRRHHRRRALGRPGALAYLQVWKVRAEAYAQLEQELSGAGPEVASEYASLVPKFVIDSNVMAQGKGLAAGQ